MGGSCPGADLVQGRILSGGGSCPGADLVRGRILSGTDLVWVGGSCLGRGILFGGGGGGILFGGGLVWGDLVWGGRGSCLGGILSFYRTDITSCQIFLYNYNWIGSYKPFSK